MKTLKSLNKAWVLAALAVVLLLLGGIYAVISKGLEARSKYLPPPRSAGTEADEALRRAREENVLKTLDEIRKMNAMTGRTPSAAGDPRNNSVQRTLDEINRINQMNQEMRKSQRPNPASSQPEKNR